MSAALDAPQPVSETAAMADLAHELITRHLRDACLARPGAAHGGRDGARGPPPAQPGPPPATDMFEILDGHNRILDLAHQGNVFPVRLEAFVGFLQDHGILPPALGRSFDQQERLQKCAFIAQTMFRLNLGYRYHLHAYGTFSPLLAIDFSEIAREGRTADGALIPAAFDAKRFVSLVSGRSAEWLAAASAVLHGARSPRPGPALLRALRVAGAHNRLLAYRAARALDRFAPDIPGPCPEGDDDA